MRLAVEDSILEKVAEVPRYRLPALFRMMLGVHQTPSERTLSNTCIEMCPECAGTDLETVETNSNGESVSESYVCNTCNCRWERYFMLLNTSIINHGNNHKEVACSNPGKNETQTETNNQTNKTNAR